MSAKKYSFIKSILPENALNFSRRTRYVCESMIERIYPQKIILPMKQHYGVDAIPTVEPGDEVQIGQCVGAPAPGTFSVPVHSGISGKVTEIKTITLPNGVTTKAIVIESDRKRTYHPSLRPRQDLNVDASTAMGIIKSAGIVGMGGEGIPTIAKINRAKKLKVKELLVNCLQSEPYATCDLHRICDTPDYIVMGAVVVAGILGINKIRFLISSDRKLELGYLQNSIDGIKGDHPDLTFEVLHFKERFPQGHFRLIARALYSVELNENDTLEESVGAVLFNCSTLNAVWEAVADNMPFCSRIVSVSGDTTDGHNVLVPIGTPIRDVLSKMSPVFSSCRIVWGNALTGLSCTDLDTPIIKTTSAITVIKMLESPKTPCIHCGMCYDACPMDITPSICYKLIDSGLDTKAMLENAYKCIACGACSYVCPAGLDLTGTIASFAAKIKKPSKTNKELSNNSRTRFTMDKIDIGDASLLEAFAENEDGFTEDMIDEDTIVLPFEGGKYV